MSGLYLHIPFCKQACHYCDFHFSTQLKNKEALLAALHKEIALRKDGLGGIPVETLYFGGGTPSVLEVGEIEKLIGSVYRYFQVAEDVEITLEANPDDLSKEKILRLSTAPVNRLSIGVQSFFDDDLNLMNRAHNSKEAEQSIQDTMEYFDNVSLDLIYGIPGLDDGRWRQNIEMALALGVPHISSYALTVEPKTALQVFIANGTVSPPDDEQAQRQFTILVEALEAEGFINYELSNFGKKGFFSRNNTAYWQGKPYLGIGPSAHSFDGKRRGWNVRNNAKYSKALAQEILPIEYESLTKKDRYNEYVMTGLRTLWGVSLSKVEADFGPHFRRYLEKGCEKYVKERLLFFDGDTLLATKKGKFLVDGIASDLFMINLG